MKAHYRVIEIVGSVSVEAGPEFHTFPEASRYLHETDYHYINYFDGAEWHKKVTKSVMILTFPNIAGDNELHLRILEAICGPTAGQSMVDLCCYHAPTTPKLGFTERTYVDIQDRGLDNVNEQQYFVKADVFAFLNAADRFDVSICIDGIEHFSKAWGYKLLELMTMASDKQIIFTPLGEYMVDPTSEHPDTHKSGWQPMDGYANIVIPNYHPALNRGALYFFKCPNLEQEFQRVTKELSWIA